MYGERAEGPWSYLRLCLHGMAGVLYGVYHSLWLLLSQPPRPGTTPLGLPARIFFPWKSRWGENERRSCCINWKVLLVTQAPCGNVRKEKEIHELLSHSKTVFAFCQLLPAVFCSSTDSWCLLKVTLKKDAKKWKRYVSTYLSSQWLSGLYMQVAIWRK